MSAFHPKRTLAPTSAPIGMAGSTVPQKIARNVGFRLLGSARLFFIVGKTTLVEARARLADARFREPRRTVTVPV